MNTFITTYFLPLNIHPLFIVTIVYILGIALGMPFFLSCALFIAGIGLCAWAAYGKHYANSSYLLATISIIALAFGSIRLHYVRMQFDDFHHKTAHGVFTAYGSITSVEKTDTPRFDQCIAISVETLVNSATQEMITIQRPMIFQLYTPRTRGLIVGDSVSFDNLTFKQAKKSSFQDYLLKEGVAAFLFIDKPVYKLINRPHYSLTRSLFYYRQKTYNALRRAMSPQTFRLFSLIFLGKKTIGKQPIERIKQHFNTWGVTHYLARSGLHMVILAIMWYMLLNLLPFHIRYKQIILLVLSGIYYLMSWPSISFCRAFIQFILYKISMLLFTDAHVLHIITITCLGVLLYNPMQLFFLDFQLSFGLTFALAWFNHLHNQHYRRQHHKSIALAQSDLL